jgi:GntR family histidine utilization transcriptional repressor
MRTRMRAGVMATDDSTPAAAPGGGSHDPRRYQQIAREVRDLITSGAIMAGQPAPTVTELSARYGTARQTAAKALQLLTDEGLLIRYPGFGYYVLPGAASGPAPG